MDVPVISVFVMKPAPPSAGRSGWGRRGLHRAAPTGRRAGSRSY
ncbi:hypothetical protein BX265_3570 [Streptomyces sp. TLI_235]|nr:hypothetical protein BX265_3570 [Streptomyces sp. TLI_235]